MAFWPAGYQGAISLTFDDGMGSHLNLAIPELNARDLQATFYLNPRGSEEDAARGLPWRAWLEKWLPAHKAGHELGNHTVMHPCSLNTRNDWSPNLLDMTLAQIKDDVMEAQRRLAEVVPAQKETSFAYPCYESTVGRGPTRTSYTPLIAQHFVAARARGELQGRLANDPLYCDLHHLSSWGVERCTGAFMIGLVEQAVELGRWGVFTFHGVQEGHLPIGSTDFVELLEHLARHRDRVWTAPVATVGAYVRGKTVDSRR